MPSRAFLQDDRLRFTLHTRSALGAAALKEVRAAAEQMLTGGCFGRKQGCCWPTEDRCGCDKQGIALQQSRHFSNTSRFIISLPPFLNAFSPGLI